MEFSEAVIDPSNTNPPGEREDVLVGLGRKGQKDFGFKLFQADVFGIEGLSLKAFEDVVDVSKVGWARAPDTSVLQLLNGDVTRWYVCRIVVRIDMAPLRLLSGSLNLSNTVLDEYL